MIHIQYLLLLHKHVFTFVLLCELANYIYTHSITELDSQLDSRLLMKKINGRLMDNKEESYYAETYID